jgi:hypothetical protein
MSQDDIVYLQPESMLNNDDNTELLATCDVPTQPGVLRSKWYNIELHVPTEQSIDVRILPAFDLLGQLTPDGSTMLFPPIVQCTGIPVGTLKLSFDVHASDTHVDSLQIWYRNDTSGAWSKHDATIIQYDKITNTRSVVASITHFTQYILVLDLHHLTDDYIERTISRNIVLESNEDGLKPKRAFWNPYSEKKFFGNLTDTRLEVYAKAAGTTTTGNTNTGTLTIAPAVHGISVASLSGAHATTASNQTTPFVVTYSIDPWSLRALPPHNLPIKEINQGGARIAAQIAICSDIIISTTLTSNSTTALATTPASSSTALVTTPSNSSTAISAGSNKEFVLWDIKELRSGQFIVMRQQRMNADRPPQEQLPSRKLTDVGTVLKGLA